ncbi:MAG: hypothetical protein RSB38_00230 [Oscillospiraceae bacterium]
MIIPIKTRLYKKYYPIKTEAEAQQFIARERKKLLHPYPGACISITIEENESVSVEDANKTLLRLKYIEW